MTVRLELRHPSGRTAIAVGAGALDELAAELAAVGAERTVFVVTSRPVGDLHLARLDPLRRRAARWRVLEAPDGEDAKTLRVAEELWRRMLAEGGKRDSLVVALGGGSIGDLAGFVAGGFLRGVELIQVPTTLLAQVDAAIGGKAAVNLPEAKNSVGLFHHPRLVVCDTRLLATLDPAELRSGLFEVVKTAVVLDRELFERLESECEPLLAGEAESLAPVVARTAAAKTKLVERDPAERDRRRLLNFGHTLGHALEAELGYRGLRHGEAVGYGMLFAFGLAETRGLPAAAGARGRGLVRRLGLPPLPALDVEALLRRMAQDKKAREGGLAWVLPERLGRGVVVEGVPESEVRERLARFLADPRG